MNEHREPPDGEDIDTGQPLAELARLREEPSTTFLDRIRNSIHRRLSVADALDFSLMGLFDTFFEYLKVILQAVGDRPRGTGKGE